MVGFRAAGWTCCGTIVLALIIAVVGMRGVGLVGQQPDISHCTKEGTRDIETTTSPSSLATDGPSHNGSIATLTSAVDPDVEKGSMNV